MSLQSQKLLEQQTSHSIQPDSNHFNNNFEKKVWQKSASSLLSSFVFLIFTFSNSFKVLQQKTKSTLPKPLPATREPQFNQRF